MKVLYLDLKKPNIWKFYEMVGEYVNSVSRQTIRFDKIEETEQIPRDTSSIDLIVVDHPTSNDARILRELVQRDPNLKILLTRFDLPQKTPEEDPDFKRIYIVDKFGLADGIVKLLQLT